MEDWQIGRLKLLPLCGWITFWHMMKRVQEANGLEITSSEGATSHHPRLESLFFNL